MAAGALPVGKTNLDQFATGLVGTRSPYGSCASVADPTRISGGSSSGSGVAVGRRRRAARARHRHRGLGPRPGRLQRRRGREADARAGQHRGRRARVPLARLRVGVLRRRGAGAAGAGGDRGAGPRRRLLAARAGAPGARGRRAAAHRDPRRRSPTWSRPRPRPGRARVGRRGGGRRRARRGRPRPVPGGRPAALRRALGGGALRRRRRGARARRPGDRSRRPRHRPRPATTGPRSRRSARSSSSPPCARAPTRRGTAIDALLLPTAPFHPTHAEVAADPIGVNARLGTYTTFANLLDLCAVAVPAGPRADGLPFGVTLLAPAFHDARAARPRRALARAGRGVRPRGVRAHLRGMPLNPQLLELGARFVRATATAPVYRLVALPGGPPARPGLVAPTERGRPDPRRGLAPRRRRARAAHRVRAGAAGDRDRRARRRHRGARLPVRVLRDRRRRGHHAWGGWRAYCEGRWPDTPQGAGRDIPMLRRWSHR